MQKMYKGKPVTVLRPAREGDQGFVAAQQPAFVGQHLVRVQGGPDIAVLHSDISEAPDMVPVMEQKKVAAVSSTASSTVAWTSTTVAAPLTKKAG